MPTPVQPGRPETWRQTRPTSARTRPLERTLFFFLIMFVISPLQFSMDWWHLFRGEVPALGAAGAAGAALASVMAAGPLFFFAIPVAAGTAFEILDNPHLRGLLTASRTLRFILCLCPAPFLAMLFEYFRVCFGAAAPDDLYLWVQGGSALLALCLACTVKFRLYRLK